jgi:bidirectional [NiFe] hydrogenase diaphorase subunit
MAMIRMTLDGKPVAAEQGETLLAVARREGVEIPTLCHHEALGTYGVCRLCVVEVSGSLPRSIRISCGQEALDGLVVETESERVRKIRRVLLELLLARSPGSAELAALARRFEGAPPRFEGGETSDLCVRCGRCVRACREKLGLHALCFAGRGQRRTVSTDFARLSQSCIGCGTCAQLCPTGAIRMKDEGDQRTIATGDQVVARFSLVRCRACGRPYATRKQLDFVARRADEAMGIAARRVVCPDCARLESAPRFLTP